MRKIGSIAVAAALCGMGAFAFAQDMRKQDAPSRFDMKKMDTNGDGMVSKDEYMSYHESIYNSMKKGSNGMVSTRDMETMMMNPVAPPGPASPKERGSVGGGKSAP